MESSLLIPADSFCSSHDIAITFIEDLHSFGLVTIVSKQDNLYIPEAEILKIERILTFNKELEINLPGVETILHILERIEHMQQNLSKLENQLKRYQ